VRGAALAAILVVTGTACTAPVASAELCGALTIPTQLGLTCTAAPEIGLDAVEVGPVEGTFAALSRLTLRPLTRSEDELAWTDPAAWLQRQITLDTSGTSARLGGLGQDPDSPFAGPEAEGALKSLENMLSGLARLPLSACNDPAETSLGRWTMDCSFTAGGIGLLVQHRLVAVGERRWGMTLRAANGQRLRHFEAIANSFAPPPPA
jgi:hypothetical protein